MKITGKKVLLYIEPKFNKDKNPVIDELTIKMFNEIKPILLQEYNPFSKMPSNWGSYGRGKSKEIVFHPGVISLGHHKCICGATSSGCDYLLSNGLITNLLCVHYLAYHRNEVSPVELEKVRNLNSSSILLEEDKDFFYKISK